MGASDHIKNQKRRNDHLSKICSLEGGRGVEKYEENCAWNIVDLVQIHFGPPARTKWAKNGFWGRTIFGPFLPFFGPLFPFLGHFRAQFPGEVKIHFSAIFIPEMDLYQVHEIPKLSPKRFLYGNSNGRVFIQSWRSDHPKLSPLSPRTMFSAVDTHTTVLASAALVWISGRDTRTRGFLGFLGMHR